MNFIHGNYYQSDSEDSRIRGVYRFSDITKEFHRCGMHIEPMWNVWSAGCIESFHFKEIAPFTEGTFIRCIRSCHYMKLGEISTIVREDGLGYISLEGGYSIHMDNVEWIPTLCRFRTKEEMTEYNGSVPGGWVGSMSKLEGTPIPQSDILALKKAKWKKNIKTFTGVWYISGKMVTKLEFEDVKLSAERFIYKTPAEKVIKPSIEEIQCKLPSTGLVDKKFTIGTVFKHNKNPINFNF